MEFDRLIEIVHQMHALQQEFNATVLMLLGSEKQLPPPAPKTEEKLMGRLQVQDYLDISKTTYYLKVREGKLKPMKLPGGHKYYKSDLLAEYNESIRRGRI